MSTGLVPSEIVNDEIPELSAETWQQLCDGSVLVVKISGFATPDECARLVAAAETVAFDKYENVDPPIDRIGVTVFEHDGAHQESYFEQANQARLLQHQIFAASLDPLDRLRRLFLERVGVGPEVAKSDTHGDYYAGLVRRIEHGTLIHVDYAPGEHAHWLVTQVKHQFAWNLYAELKSTAGGRTTVWNRRWERGDDANYKIPNSYGYEEGVVAGADFVRYQPTLGDVYLINTETYHTVEPCNGRRTTVTSALGVLDDDSLILWS